jgi:hypothetical protein
MGQPLGREKTREVGEIFRREREGRGKGDRGREGGRME